MSRALDEAIYREYQTFFAHAEKSRRWSVEDDLPWELAERTPRDPSLARAAEIFAGVEMYLPDYVAGGINVVRSRFGQSWFIANWAYEESKHTLALREYLLRTGQRTPDEMYAFEEQVLAKKWTLPFETPRLMTLYGALQELTTFMSYKKQEQLAEARGDRLLAKIYQVIGRDEMAHCGFHTRVARLLLEEDPEGTKDDLAHVYRSFKMPAADLLPGWSEHVESMKAAGLDSESFIGEVALPLLRRLGLTRRDLRRPRASAPPA